MSRRLADALELAELRSAELDALARRAEVYVRDRVAEQHAIPSLYSGQAALALGAFHCLFRMKDRVSGLPRDAADEIGDSCGARFADAWNILLRVADTHDDYEEAYLKAFAACQRLAGTLRSDLQAASTRAIATGKEVSAAQHAYRVQQALHMKRLAKENREIAQRTADPKENYRRRSAAADFRNLARLHRDQDARERRGDTRTFVVKAAMARCMPFLGSALDGNVRAITRRFEAYRTLAEIGPGLIGAGMEMLGAAPGIPSPFGLFTGVLVRRWSEPWLGRKQAAMEAAYRVVTVHTLSTFLLPFAACTAGSLRVLEASDRLLISRSFSSA